MPVYGIWRTVQQWEAHTTKKKYTYKHRSALSIRNENERKRNARSISENFNAVHVLAVEKHSYQWIQVVGNGRHLLVPIQLCACVFNIHYSLFFNAHIVVLIIYKVYVLYNRFLVFRFFFSFAVAVASNVSLIFSYILCKHIYALCERFFFRVFSVHFVYVWIVAKVEIL